MMWVKGQPARCVGSLLKLNEQIRDYAPRAVPPATDPDAWGWIADDAHSSTSDHYPHFYAALGSEAVVCARDFPHAPALGLDGGVVTEALRMSRDPRIGYVIFNRRITGPNHGWRWDPYIEKDPHDTHFHVSSVHTAVADDTRAWTLPAGDDMDANQAKQLADVHYTLTTGTPEHVRWATLMPLVQAIAAKVDIDPAELAAIEAAAKSGAAAATGDFADTVVARVLAGLPEGTLTKADVEQAVRDAFAGGLAPAG